MRISDWSSDVCSSDLASVLIAALGPGDAEAVLRGANDARNIDRDLKFADLREGIVGPRIVIERLRAGGTSEIIGTEPVGTEPDRIAGDRAEMLDEAREGARDLRIGRPMAAAGGRRETGRAYDRNPITTR